LAERIENHTGASFLLREPIDERLEFTTLDVEASNRLREVSFVWDGVRMERALSANRPSLDGYYDAPPDWATQWSGRIEPPEWIVEQAADAGR